MTSKELECTYSTRSAGHKQGEEREGASGTDITSIMSQTSGSGKHLLVSGSPGVGKTSLLLTLARGIFPPEAVPKRFEGWTVFVRYRWVGGPLKA